MDKVMNECSLFLDKNPCIGEFLGQFANLGLRIALYFVESHDNTIHQLVVLAQYTLAVALFYHAFLQTFGIRAVDKTTDYHTIIAFFVAFTDDFDVF